MKKFNWQQELSNLVRDPHELWQRLALDPQLLEGAIAASKLFPLKATDSYIQRMKKGDINDPLLRQILPLATEEDDVAEYVSDPLKEADVNPVKGLLHKYHGRVLVTLTAACAVHCRYCFRRDFPYEENNPGQQGMQAIFSYIENDSSIKEVILSGGDPLTVPDKTLQMFSQGLAQIGHVNTLRIHSRLPIVLPSRVTEAFCEWVRSVPFKVVMVVHCNHANEINAEVATALAALQAAGALLLNQSVLLQGVNDSADALVALSEALFAVGVLPYYLHTLDKVKGAHHFDLDRAVAKRLHDEMLVRLPGYLVPSLVVEKAGAGSKVRL